MAINLITGGITPRAKSNVGPTPTSSSGGGGSAVGPLSTTPSQTTRQEPKRELRYVDPTASAVSAEAGKGTPIIIISNVRGKVPPSPKGYVKSVNAKTGQVTYVKRGYEPSVGWGATPVGTQISAGTHTPAGSPEAIAKAKKKEGQIEKGISDVGKRADAERFTPAQRKEIDTIARRYGFTGEKVIEDPRAREQILKSEKDGKLRRVLGTEQALKFQEDVETARQTRAGLSKYGIGIEQEGRRLKARGEFLKSQAKKGRYPTASIEAYNKAVAEYERKSGRYGELSKAFSTATTKLSKKQEKTAKEVESVGTMLGRPDMAFSKGVKPEEDFTIKGAEFGLEGKEASRVSRKVSEEIGMRRRQVAEADIFSLPVYGEVAHMKLSQLSAQQALQAKEVSESFKRTQVRGVALEKRAQYQQELLDLGYYKKPAKGQKVEQDIFSKEYRKSYIETGEGISKLQRTGFEIEKYGRFERTPESLRLAGEQAVIAGVSGLAVATGAGAVFGGLSVPAVISFGAYSAEASLLGKGLGQLEYERSKSLEKATVVDVATQIVVPVTGMGLANLSAKALAGRASVKVEGLTPKVKVTEMGAGFDKVRIEGGIGQVKYETKLFGKTVFERKAIVSLKGEGIAGPIQQPLTQSQSKAFLALERKLPAELILKEGRTVGIAGRAKLQFYKKSLIGSKWGAYGGTTKMPYAETTIYSPTVKGTFGKEALNKATQQYRFLEGGKFATASEYGGKTNLISGEFETKGLARFSSNVNLEGLLTERAKVMATTQILADKGFQADIYSVSKKVTRKTPDTVGTKDPFGGAITKESFKGASRGEKLTDFFVRTQAIQEMQVKSFAGGGSQVSVQQMAMASAPKEISTGPTVLASGASGVSISKQKVKEQTKVMKNIVQPKVKLKTEQIKKVKTRDLALLKSIQLKKTKTRTREKILPTSTKVLSSRTVAQELKRGQVLPSMAFAKSTVREKQKLKIEPAVAELLTPRAQIQKQRKAPSFRELNIARMATPELETLKGAPMPTFDFPKPKRMRSKRDEFGTGYDVFLKREGKMAKISSRPLSKKEALGLGAMKADIGAGATFDIRKTGIKVRKKDTGIWEKLKGRFYRGKEGYVERTQFRISSAGEKEEITMKGLATLADFPKLRQKKRKKRGWLF